MRFSYYQSENYYDCHCFGLLCYIDLYSKRIVIEDQSSSKLHSLLLRYDNLMCFPMQKPLEIITSLVLL